MRYKYPTLSEAPSRWELWKMYWLLRLRVHKGVRTASGKTIYDFNAKLIFWVGTDEEWRINTPVHKRGSIVLPTDSRYAGEAPSAPKPSHNLVGPYLIPRSHSLGTVVVESGDPDHEHEFYLAPWDRQYGEWFGDVDEKEMAKPGIAFPMATFRDLWKCTGCPAAYVTSTRSLV